MSAGRVRKKVALVHTSFVLVEALNDLFDEIIAEVERVHIVEHSLLSDVLEAGRVNHETVRRMCGYFALAESTGADLILNVCSSVGETVDVARQFIRTPILKIDEPMAEEAVALGDRIGVLATLATTLEPTCRLVQRKAIEAGSDIEVVRGLCEGAYEALTAGEIERHDSIVLAKLRELSDQVDGVVLAQATMGRVVDQVDPAELAVPILTSMRRGVLRVKSRLDL